MSETLLDFDTWPTGIASPSIPANNNARRAEVLAGVALSATTTAQPGSPAELDIYIIPAAATGTFWASFAEHDVAIYSGGTWTAFAPFEGLRKFVLDEGTDGENWQFLAGVWAAEASGGGGAVSSVNSQTGAVVLDAADIAITDAGGHFTATDVEGALQELGAGGGGGGGEGNAVVTIISGTTYTAAASDAGSPGTAPNFMRFTNTSAKSATFDPESTTPLPANGEWYFYNQGASNLTIIAGSGVTINRPGGASLIVASGNAVMVKRLAADLFLVLP